MTITEALKELDTCDWLKITRTHVHASRWKTRAEILMEFQRGGDPAVNPSTFRSADVMVRRSKTESFEALLIRAAELVRAGHVPKIRVPPLTPKDRCACGDQSRDLAWNDQLKQRMCRKCSLAWATAAKNNDMKPSRGIVQ